MEIDQLLEGTTCPASIELQLGDEFHDPGAQDHIQGSPAAAVTTEKLRKELHVTTHDA